MRPVRNQWPTSDIARNVKFAAQTFREALTVNNFESFRVATLDVMTLLKEVITLTSDAKRGKFPIKTIFPCLAELKSAIECDPTASMLVGSELQLLKRSFSEGKVSDKNLHLLTALSRTMGRRMTERYRAALSLEMCEEMKIPRNSEKIRRTVNTYCSYLINSGYSRQHVLEIVEEWFFSRPIKKVESRTTARFLAKFDGKNRKYLVYVPVTAAFGEYVRKVGLGNPVSVDYVALPNDVKNEFSTRPSTYRNLVYLRVHVEAKDEYAALRDADERVNALLAVTYIGSRGIRFDEYNWTFVKLKRGTTGRLIERERPFLQQVSGTVTSRTLRRLREQTTQVFSEFTPQSTARMLSAINMAGLARATPRPENQLVALWSAIEVLLSDPPPGVSRVQHYVDTLAPCVCIKYARRYVVAVYDEVRLHYPRHVREFFRRPDFASNVDQYTKFSSLLFDPAFRSLQRPFCSGLADNPLALYRLWKVEKNFATPESYLSAFDQHEQRVRWHLYRIYRTRNAIVHSGRKPTFLVPLLMNVFEYFNGSVGPILGRASAEDHDRSIDQIVAEIRFDLSIMKDDLLGLKSNSTFTPAEIARFHG